MPLEVRQFGSSEAMASGECFQDGEDIQEMPVVPKPRGSCSTACSPGTLMSAAWLDLLHDGVACAFVTES